ncbi:hypothetical protein FRE64_15725 [Euhalothece natronophila Z-M001]|uniref:Uncharacterized protein n=1 Tax=Euhalothece natronophila Z-M001 TaxID=522448 RepID=A0A5B8NPK5_9CHRO|nr:hypothetical protein [Euhalothece natronophila]QDZ41263.1 hypothetical protein FRE64_15725 [Euhalothece natronophila Z-M001]
MNVFVVTAIKMLRESKIRKHLKSDSPYISESDFCIERNDSKLLAISYFPDRRYYFDFEFVSETEGNLSLSPSYLMEVEEIFSIEILELEKYLANWVTYISEEISTFSHIKIINEQQFQINHLIEKFEISEEEYFTEEEVILMKERLDELKTDYQYELQKQDISINTFQEKIENFNQEVDILKELLGTYSKSGFLRKSFPSFTKLLDHEPYQIKLQKSTEWLFSNLPKKVN